ncbi:MAG TPA: nicotinate phosphoribosyltransferase [Phycisphaerae bacterium]|nr:nicotinate phosphoribosyltransferase [Phycisphaerae bacterium]HRR85302.1 nicotinate phosphoribosyltransferase [Phycisphaerae bacterium]
MRVLDRVYRESLTLLTDLYLLTMANGYWKLGRAEDEAVFHLFFRKHPFGGGYTITCGLEYVLDLIRGFRFSNTDLEYLAGLRGNDDAPLFEPAFLDYLGDLRLRCDIAAIPEGTVVFPQEPLIRVQGPLLECQLLETHLLNIINFQSLIATKASRICLAASGGTVLEFGLRRAQGMDGGLAASRAAYIGGCDATSNVLAGKLFGIPVRGTHAHSWVMSFDGELEAFDAYAKAMPNNCIFLVDTYNTLEGVAHAIEVGRRLRESGHKMIGIRLDSGDLAYLSIEARKMLDAAGFTDARIVASNDLDEETIRSLKDQEAAISIWGVGTRLITAHDEPALGGVYKLSAIRRRGGAWKDCVKVSEQAMKTTAPGIQQVRRFRMGQEFIGDMIYDERLGICGPPVMIDPVDPTRRKMMPADAEHEDLLVPVVIKGQVIYQSPAISDIRERAGRQLAALHKGIKRFLNPHEYPTGLEQRLYDLKTKLVLQARNAPV